MIKKLHHIVLLLFSTLYLAQVDVVYNDLVWSDEFSTNGAVDNVKWFHQTQLPVAGGWYNNEQQHYTNSITNSFTNNGELNIVAKKEVFTDQGFTKNYTSARLNSKFAFKYGRVDVRAKVPKNQGTWPAIWLLGKNVNEPGGYFASTFGNTNWPACGEIDMMEYGIFPSAPDNFIQSTLHTPSSSGNSVNHGGMLASSDITANYHIYSMNWSPNQITFLLDGVAYYTYNPSVKNASTWPFDKEQYLLLNIAMGGVAGTIPSTFTDASMIIDYVRVYQNTTPDTVAPTNFTATVGAVTSDSVELLLNATDNFGAITYQISGGATQTVYGTSGIPKSVIISGLSPTTSYTFTVSASDAAGNTAANNPITVNATTLSNINTACSGTSTLASQGAFSTGYKYDFQTIGTDVKITFELLDTDKTGVVAYLWKQTPFTETPMTNVSGKKFSSTITGQTAGSPINYAVKFAYAGGMSVTKYYSYVVGDACISLGVTDFLKAKELLYPNPVENILNLKLPENKNMVTLYDFSGKKLFEKNVGTTLDLDFSSFTAGTYLIRIENSKGANTYKIVKK
ncbi:family 16 glycosylhydrolase [Chryseobacterium gambrini]|uniref:Por secretion system C-terminal sorting domain-containing protein n=1 Tax=Chryseobacterium gambrini TaxID=373672 RepID=A0A1N7NXI3_9FLAO|nr:family 16 glycosylhydrolase [Chryseobacterium gambrini]SIT03085.1 Por secretion system C-terminal sorting domain-containing protein [Chryseobacterium gambrini]